eukprot:TRINITY_DN5178_c0_g1_i1.p1 TRINITY_DN5178_c0_g1~~TRINITY_DN5178_c0_g1_i1.p1  ORF type:complete len:459 (+),score=89.91 TRINITY_DN5178_c0_g1_i1:25-1377(+)
MNNDEVRELRAMFAGGDLGESVIFDVLSQNKGKVDDSIDCLLQMTQTYPNTKPDPPIRNRSPYITTSVPSAPPLSPPAKVIEQDDFIEIQNLPHPPSTPPPPTTNVLSYVWGWLNPTGSDVKNKGLQNYMGENNCFLNVVIQSLYHLRSFQSKFAQYQDHSHLTPEDGKSCPFCALKMICTQYHFAEDEQIPPTALREALSALYQQESRFQMGTIDDAAEAHNALLTCLHNTLAGAQFNEDKKCKPPCMVHQCFNMNIVEFMKCDCGAKPAALPFTEFIHYVPAVRLREQSMNHLALTDSGDLYCTANLSHLLKEIHRSDTRECQGCKQMRRVQTTIVPTYPEIFTVGINWSSASATLDLIFDIVNLISETISLIDSFDIVQVEQTYQLRGMICYYGRHYNAFFQDEKTRVWRVFDDTCVKQVGAWSEVVKRVRDGRFQPMVVFYEKQQK